MRDPGEAVIFGETRRNQKALNQALGRIAQHVAPLVSAAELDMELAIGRVAALLKEHHHRAPRCPKCGARMSLRTAKKQEFYGNRFWGCDNYFQNRNKCKYLVPFDEWLRGEVF